MSPPPLASRFGQSDSVKVIPEVFVGDVERSPEAKEIMRLVAEHAVMAAAHGGRAVVLYSESLIASVRQVTRCALAQARAAERRERSQLQPPPCLSSIFAFLQGGGGAHGGPDEGN